MLLTSLALILFGIGLAIVVYIAVVNVRRKEPGYAPRTNTFIFIACALALVSGILFYFSL